MKIQYTLRNYLDATTHTAVGASLRQWCKMLYRNLGQLEWRFVPRILFISTVVLLYTPLRIFERVFYHNKVKRIKVKDPVFILGHYRSGTTFLHYLMCQDDRFDYASTLQVINPHTFLGSLGVSRFITSFVLPERRPMDNLKMSPKLPFEEEFALANLSDASLCHGYFFPDQLQQQFDEMVMLDTEVAKQEWSKHFYYFCQKLSFRNPGKQLILKTPANTARISAILELFPNAKFVHIHRNPYKVYLSNERLYEGILPILAFHRASDKAVKEFILDSYEKTMRRFIRDRQLLASDQLIEFAYEDFVKDPLRHLSESYQKLGLGEFAPAAPAVQQVLEEYQSYRLNSYSLDEEVREEIADRWAFAFEAFAYSVVGAPEAGPMTKVAG